MIFVRMIAQPQQIELGRRIGRQIRSHHPARGEHVGVARQFGIIRKTLMPLDGQVAGAAMGFFQERGADGGHVGRSILQRGVLARPGRGERHDARGRRPAIAIVTRRAGWRPGNRRWRLGRFTEGFGLSDWFHFGATPPYGNLTVVKPLGILSQEVKDGHDTAAVV